VKWWTTWWTRCSTKNPRQDQKESLKFEFFYYLLLSRPPHFQINYLPSFSTKFIMHVMTSVPTWLQDWVLSRNTIPDVPPPGAPGKELND
jgi:hypothetical protein